jgi:hypothetical protein
MEIGNYLKEIVAFSLVIVFTAFILMPIIFSRK